MSQENHTNDPLEELRFDADNAAERSKAANELKKQNMKAVFGTGKGRLSVTVLGIALIGMALWGAAGMFKKERPQPADDRGSNAVLGRLPEGDANVTSDEEAAKRKQAIAQRSAEAHNQNAPYLAPTVLRAGDSDLQGQGTVAAAQGSASSAQPTAPVSTRSTGSAAQTQQAQQANEQLRQQQIADLRAMRERILKSDISPQINVVMGDSSKDMAARFTTAQYTVPDRSKEAGVARSGTSAAGAANSSSAAAQCSVLISAGDAYYATLTYATNSDDGANIAIAEVEQGKYAGARAIGTPKFSTNNVTVDFDKLSIPGQGTLAIKATAINEETYRTGVADDVDTHAFRRFGTTFLASVAKGFGEGAKMVTGTTTTISNATTGQTTTIVPELSTSRRIQIAAGEVGTDIGDMLKAENAALKPTISSLPKKNVGLVFLADVCDKKI